MPTIKPLSSQLISKIAAGEVIERPVFAVKELLENAIDAQAKYIRIDLEQSGLQKIMITDDGIGMAREDILVSFQHHTTSKIQTEEHLNSIQTLGFRGEALHSIATISNLTIKSRCSDETSGTEIYIEEGKLIDQNPIGMPVGTTITVENLFHSVPARKEFLKHPNTEYRHILDLISSIAIAHPEIRFFLTHNTKTIVDIPKHDSLFDRVQLVLGENTARFLLPIQTQDSYIQLNGFIAKPQLHYNSAKHFLFINNRKVQHTSIVSAVREAFGTLLEPNVFPFFLLFLEIPPHLLDVNVHPRKEQVRIFHEEQVLDLVKKAVSDVLFQQKLTYIDKRWKSKNSHEMLEDLYVRDGNTQSYTADLLRKDVVSEFEKQEIQTTDISQLHNLFLVTQTQKGIILIDQHAAHERILYEQFVEAFQQRKQYVEKFELTKSIILNLSISETEIIQQYAELFSNLGFEIEEFGQNTFKLCAIPLLFKDRNAEQLLREMIDDLYQEKDIKNIDSKTHRMLTYLACRSAIKAGNVLTKEERKKLIQDLQNTKNQFTCPHGRPTQIEISLNELYKMFKRK